MNRRQFLKLTAAIAVTDCLRSFALAAEKSPPKKLNFVFILIDDMGYTDAGCYGSTFYETPNIDKLAAEGMRFTNAYAASPVCSPTRASIMTGKYPARLGITQWIGAPDKPVKYVHNMPTEERTIAEALKQAGYTTAFIGKWHLGEQEKYYPENQGFDINKGGWRAGHPWAGYFSPYENPKLPDGPEGQYLTDRLTDESLKFLDENSDKPFLLYLSYYAVHTPIQAKKDHIDKYNTKAKDLPPPPGPAYLTERDDIITKQVQDHPVYAAMVESTDESIGRVTKKLEALGVSDNTAVIFMSDNGGLSTQPRKSPTANVPLRAGKGWLYEGGIREPMIIKWPGVVKPRTVCHEPVISNDFYPTMLEMAGLPPRPNQHTDGLSLVPLLKQSAKLDRSAIYWHYPHYHGSGNTPSAAVRAGDYKLIEFYDEGQVELYNLKDDIGEKNNLAAQMLEKTAQLKKMLRDWQKSVDAPMPQPNPGYKAKTEN
ncbi:MAG: sulfatase [Planctomycetota bacterium]|jgi:arylsulfatase A-like enzyme